MRTIYQVLIGCLAVLFAIPPVATADDSVADSLLARFNKQLQVYPQEKLYLQTDKPYYIGGEDLWFRVYLMDYTSHIPDTTSRYVYTELLDPHNSLVRRVKTIPREGAYFGHIPLEEILPEGMYQLRSYTRYMEGLGDTCLYRKKIYIGGPLSAVYRTNVEFDFEDDGAKARIRLSFADIKTGGLISPKEVRYTNKRRVVEVLKMSEDSIVRISCDPDKELVNRMLYIEYDYEGRFHKQFIPVPYPESAYDVAFFPEGGHFPAETSVRIAFKAMRSNGLGEYVEGKIVDAMGGERGAFSSNVLGMGSFSLKASASEQLYAVCRNNQGVEKRFKLPVAEQNSLILQAQWTKNILNLFVTNESDKLVPSDLYLMLQCRGVLLYCRPWDNSRKYLQLSNAELPSGVLQASLVDKNLHIVSERLVFNLNKEDQADIALQANHLSFGCREQICSDISLKDAESNPLNGSLSVSVTSDREVQPDSSNTILTTLLLTSELKGYIENPGWYFSASNPKGLNELDHLMLTQGWSRYYMKGIIRDSLEYPKGLLEVGPEITGTVGSGLGYLLKKPGYQVSITSFVPPFYEMTETRENGRFCFTQVEMPEGTRFLVQALTKKEKGRATLNLTVAPIAYPDVRYALPWEYTRRKYQIESYMQAADDQYTKEHGIRTVFLDEVVIEAKKKGKSPLSVDDSRKIPLRRIEGSSAETLYILLKSIGDLNVTQDQISWSGGGTPLIVIDEQVFDEMDFLIGMSKDLLEEVEIIKPATSGIQQLTGKFGEDALKGVVLITTKARDGGFPQRNDTNKKSIMPLGYQQVKEFYSPRYETEEELKKVPFDLRTTLYWNPNIKIIDGKATFNFYAADVPGSYTATLEGLSVDGKLFRKIHTIHIHQ